MDPGCRVRLFFYDTGNGPGGCGYDDAFSPETPVDKGVTIRVVRLVSGARRRLQAGAGAREGEAEDGRVGLGLVAGGDLVRCWRGRDGRTRRSPCTGGGQGRASERQDRQPGLHAPS